MAAHKYADMICAKANNMGLVTFINTNDGWGWRGLTHGSLPSFIEDNEYFLCLPQHKDACLHWLNGGTSQYLSNAMSSWINFGDSKDWIFTHLLMTNECEIRIKPQKEKRWIAVNPKTGYTSSLSENEGDIKKAYKVGTWQIREIEVEV